MTTGERWGLTLGAMLFVCALAPLGVGCGGSATLYRGDVSVEPERENPVRLEAEQREAAEQLDGLLASPERSCDGVCELEALICDLSMTCVVTRSSSQTSPSCQRTMTTSSRMDSPTTEETCESTGASMPAPMPAA